MRQPFMLKKKLAVLGTLVALAVGGLPPAFSQDTVTLNFVNADIPSVVKAIGGHTGKNFIIDPRVTGNMNIISQTPVSKADAYQILLSALRVAGYATVEERGVVKIVPEADAAKSGGPVVGVGAPVSGERLVTQVITLHNESAAQMATLLRSQVPPNSFIGALPGSNSLVITDYAENVKRIVKIIAAIDVPTSADLQLIQLKYASAVDVANLLKGLMPETAANPVSPGVPPKLNIGVEPRTNSLIVRADSPALVTRIKALLAGLDIPTASGGNIHVVYLRNAEAAKLAETLRSVVSGSTAQSAPSSSTPAATAAQPAGATATGAAATAPANSIQAYAATNSLVIVAPDHVYNSLRTVIDKLDARRAQVAVEAIVVELTSNLAAEFGIQWQDLSGLNRPEGSQIIGGTNFNTGGNILGAAKDLSTVGGGLNVGLVRGRINIPGVGDVIGLAGLAKALESDQRAKILANPVIMTLDNEEGKIVVGQNVPFVTGNFTQTTTGATNPFQTIERRDIGLTLKVTPLITEGGTVRLKVLHEVSSVAPTPATGTLLRPADIITNKRSIDTTVLVDDGGIIALGGLIQDDLKGSDSKVPLLGDIPVLGNLFKYQSKTNDRTTLMVFLRPVVLRDAAAVNRHSADRYEYIRNQTRELLPDPNFLLGNAPGGKLESLTDPAREKATSKPLLDSPAPAK